MKNYPSAIAASLLLAAFLPSLMQAQPIPLASTWSQYDLQEQQGHSAGLLSLTAESSSGFTATISSNGIAVGGDYPLYTGYPSKSQYLPRVYTLFAGQPITSNGQRITFSFDVKFNDVADPSNTGSFRFTMGDTNCNNSWGEFLGIGTASGSTFRYDGTITQDTNWLDAITLNYLYMPPDLSNPMNPTNYSYGSFCDLNGSSVGGGGTPNGVKMGVDTTTVHHIRFSVERTPSGLQVDSVWTNSAGAAVEHAAFAPVTGGAGDDHSGAANVSPWTNVNVFGFCLFGTGANQHFFGADPGSFTVSNLKAYSGFNVTAIHRDPITGDVTLTWESTRVDVCTYVVHKSTDLSAWNPISAFLPSGGHETSYTDIGSADTAAFYKVEKVYP